MAANQWTPYFERYGTQFGVDPSTLQNIARLESGFNPTAVNTWDVNAQRGIPSTGIMQFVQPTFTDFIGRARSEAPGVFKRWTAADWKDPEAQIALTGWALSKGLGSHWATYDRAKASQTLSNAPEARTGADPSKHLAMAQIYSQRGMAGPEYTRKFAGFKPDAGSMMGMTTTTGPAPTYEGPVATNWRFLQRLGKNLFGLRNDPGVGQTTGGGHRAGSQHYTGHAIDFGSALNTPQQLQNWWNYLNQNRGPLGVSELIWEDRGSPNEHIHVGVR